MVSGPLPTWQRPFSRHGKRGGRNRREGSIYRGGSVHGEEIEASEGQEDSARETADEARGFAGREALNQVLEPFQSFFGWAPSLIGD